MQNVNVLESCGLRYRRKRKFDEVVNEQPLNEKGTVII